MWKYTDNTNQRVKRPLDNGGEEYRLVTDAEYLAWIAEGNTPEPADPPSIADQKAAIDAQRDALLAAGVTFNGKRFHTDETFLTEMLGRIMAWQIGLYAAAETKQVRTMDNEVLQLGRDEHIAVAAAVGSHREAAYADSWAAKDAL